MLTTVFKMAVAMLATPAQAAAPVDLQCTVNDGGKLRLIDFSLNEDKGTATWQWEGSSEPLSADAVFTATKVVMKTITIDRTNLNFEQRYDYGDGLVVKRGTCKKLKVARAF